MEKIEMKKPESIGAVYTHTHTPAFIKKAHGYEKRNYQIDVMKLIFTLFVFFWHTALFINKNTRIVIPHQLGWWSVYFFFIISGFLMIKSQIKRAKKDKENPGKGALDFVIHKFKSIALPYLTAFFIGLMVYIYINGIDLSLVRRIPEIFMIQRIGIDTISINGATWYISAMLIAMLPLYYLLTKNRDSYIYVFAPLVALISYSYIFHMKSPYESNATYLTFITVGIVRAINGICFGAISYIIYEKLKKSITKKYQHIFITTAEVLLYVIIFTVWFSSNNYKEVFSVMLLLPIALAITFSQTSYVSRIFRFDCLKYVSSISLAIFFNHWAARVVVQNYFIECSYKKCLAIMICLTILFSIIYYIIMWIIRKIINYCKNKQELEGTT